MRKFFVVVLVTLFVSCLSGCANALSAPNEITYEVNNDSLSMFNVVEQTSIWKIVYHEKTKVMYAVSNSSHNYGIFTVLVDETGAPLLYEGE